MKYLFYLCAAALVFTGSARPALAQASALGSSFPIYGASSRGSAVAYDTTNHVYLVVSAYGAVNGRFVSADGQPLSTCVSSGTSFILGGAAFAHFPRVAYSPDANGGLGGFMVTWHEADSPSGGNAIHARAVSLTSCLGANRIISNTTDANGRIIAGDTTWWENGPAIAYSTVSQRFLVVWRSIASLNGAQTALSSNDINGRFLDLSGQPLGLTPIKITETATYEDNASVAYNPSSDRFLVGFVGEDSSPFVAARTVSASSGALGPQYELARSGGTYISDTTFISSTGRFLVTWYQLPGGTVGRMLDGVSGLPEGSVIPLSTRFGATDALSVAYNATSNTSFVVGHDQSSSEDGGFEVSASGIPSAGFGATNIGGTGNYYPRIAASSVDKRWMFTTANNFTTVYGQFIGTSSSGGGSGGGGGTPAPSSTPVPSTFTAPAPGAQVTAPVTFQWASRSDAQGYYLYVGTSSGAKNLVDTGQISATSYTASSLPSGTLYAKIWTLQENVWRGNEITFSVANPLPPQAAFTYPANGARNVDQGQPFQWTAVSGAQAYYLYVGTTLGAKNIVDTGEIQTTTYAMSNLPAAQTLYARIYTKQNGIWRFNDVSFTAAAALPSTLATLTYPTNGEAYDPARAIRWSSVPGAQAYYLYVGTSPGAKNVIDSGEIGSTGYTPATAIPVSNRLYASIYTKYGGKWYSVNSEFYVPGAGFIYPTNGALNVDMTYPIRWMPVANAQAYYLYVGTSPGAKDVVDTGEIQTNTFAAPNVPSGQWLYATIWTKAANIWTSRQVMFTAAPTNTGGIRSLATLLDPNNGSADADSARLFRWTPAANADKYYLYVGTSPGAKNVVDTGEIATIAMATPPLPAGQTLYARVWSRIGGVWQGQDSAFTSPGASMIYPVNNGSMNAAFPLRWTSAANAEVYYLYVGTSPGAKNLVDSGEITRTEYVATNLPYTQTLYATIWTKAGGVWRGRAITFVVKP
jgi:hypothetical protein